MAKRLHALLRRAGDDVDVRVFLTGVRQGRTKQASDRRSDLSEEHGWYVHKLLAEHFAKYGVCEVGRK